jgi:type VI secretion system lysozyme-like protein
LDRLIDREPLASFERIPKRTVTEREYAEAVRRDLVWLLNTRSAFPEKAMQGRELTVIDYGLPDFGRAYGASYDDRRRLGKVLARTIEAFEPRLREVRVTVEPDPAQQKRLQVVVEGELVLDKTRREPVSFPLILDSRPGRFMFHEWHE